MTKSYSDEELFTGQNAFYSMAFGMLMLMDPIYLMLSPIHSQYVIVEFALLTIYVSILAYSIKSFFKYILNKNSKGHYGITLHAESDEYFDSVRNYGYKQSFQFNLIFTFFCYTVFKHLPYDHNQTLESISLLFFGSLFFSYGVSVMIKLKKDEVDD